MKQKVRISIILIFSILIFNTSSVYAGSLGPNENHPTGDDSTIAMQKYNQFWDTYDALYNAVHPTQDQIKNFVKKSFDTVGFLIDETGVTFEKIRNMLIGQSNSGITSESSEEDVAEWIKNNVNGDQNNGIIFDDEYNTFVNNYARDYETNSGYWIGFAFDLRYMSGQFTGTAKYNSLKSLLSVSGNKVGIVWSSYNNVCLVPLDDYWFKVNNSNWNGTVLYSYANGTTAPVNGGYEKYTWNASLNEYVKDSSLYNSQLSGVAVSLTPNNTSSADAKALWYGKKELNIFNSVASATSYGVGVKPYYYNTNTWNDFSSSSGDYTVDNSNINTVTYGDTVSYIQDSYNETGNYPDNSTVNNWIDNSNQNNHNSGGGSGGDDSGGGSGSGDTNIFDWLKTLGAALGNLIKGVGEFLSEIVAGLVDAVTNLLQAISTLISGVLESLTNIFSGLIEFIYAGLPDDIKNILSLALVVAILITVLKLIRGN